MVGSHIFLLASFCVSLRVAQQIVEYRDDVHLSMVEMLTKYGYPSEVHYVTTLDGYILKMYRIPYGRECGAEKPRKLPVLVMHGLLSNSIDFIVAGVEKGLGYLLADDCFDVWIPNSRGNFESKNHTRLSPKSRKFWQFSWHEMGQFDVPALIDHVLNKTGQTQLHYIGHSQGTTQFFVYSSLYPDESRKYVKTMHALAPVAFVENTTSPILRLAAQHIQSLEILSELLGVDEFLPKSEVMEQLEAICVLQFPQLEELCENALFLLCGFDSKEFNRTLFPVIIAHDPAGAATKQLFHYGQEIDSGAFRQYDYGRFGNLGHYGMLQPPKYRIDRIRVPMYLHYSDNDWMATPSDVLKFASLTKTSTLVRVPLAEFNHLDYLFAKDVKKLVYDDVIRQLNAS